MLGKSGDSVVIPNLNALIASIKESCHTHVAKSSDISNDKFAEDSISSSLSVAEFTRAESSKNFETGQGSGGYGF